MAMRKRTLVLLCVLGGVAVFLVIGLAIAQDQETLRLRSDISIEDPRAAAYVASLVGAPLTRGNFYDVLTNGDQIFPAMLDAIHKAQHRISLETYVFEDGSVSEQFTAALEAAARRGVSVNIVVDLIGAAGMDDKHERRLIDAGCTVLTLNAPSWYELEEMNYRTHRKILVVDGTLGFTGGVGFADYWLGNAQDLDHWRDTHVRMRGPIVQLLEAAFYENFIEASKEPVKPAIAIIEPEPGTDGVSLLLRGAPTGGANDLKRLYLLAFAMARRSIDITTPYFVTDESTFWAFEDAIRRGVRIRLLVESDVTDAMPVKYSSRAAYQRLLELGVEIYEYLPTMMHAKVLVADGTWSMFGSANFDNRSLELNDELNIVVSSRELAARFLEDFEHDISRSERLELSKWQQRPAIDKVREKFWSFFGEVF
jgi:cardiolipin synthase A/B